MREIFVVQCYYFSRQDLFVRMPASIARLSFRNSSKPQGRNGATKGLDIKNNTTVYSSIKGNQNKSREASPAPLNETLIALSHDNTIDTSAQ